MDILPRTIPLSFPLRRILEEQGLASGGYLQVLTDDASADANRIRHRLLDLANRQISCDYSIKQRELEIQRQLGLKQIDSQVRIVQTQSNTQIRSAQIQSNTQVCQSLCESLNQWLVTKKAGVHNCKVNVSSHQSSGFTRTSTSAQISFREW